MQKQNLDSYSINQTCDFLNLVRYRFLCRSSQTCPILDQTVVTGPIRTGSDGNLSEWEGDQMHLPEQTSSADLLDLIQLPADKGPKPAVGFTCGQSNSKTSCELDLSCKARITKSGVDSNIEMLRWSVLPPSGLISMVLHYV